MTRVHARRRKTCARSTGFFATANSNSENDWEIGIALTSRQDCGSQILIFRFNLRLKKGLFKNSVFCRTFRNKQVGAPTVPPAVIKCQFRYWSFHVSLDFSDQLSVKSGQGLGQGQAQICLPRPSATALLSGRRQKQNSSVIYQRSIFLCKCVCACKNQVSRCIYLTLNSFFIY
jgi:hypothetical protein